MTLAHKIDRLLHGEPGTDRWFHKHGAAIFATLTEDERDLYTSLSMGADLATANAVATMEMERLALVQYMRDRGYTLAQVEDAERNLEDGWNLA